MPVDYVFRLGGEGGEGVISTGELLTLALARAGYDIYTFRTYPAEIKGGHANYQVRAADHLLLSQGDLVDVLLAFNEEAFDKHIKDVRPDGGVVLYDRDSFQPNGKLPKTVIGYGVPITSIAVEQIGVKITKNMVSLGVLAGLVNMPVEQLKEVVADRFRHKGESVVGKNVAAFEAGYAYARDQMHKEDRYRMGRVARPERELVLSGNDSLALGALFAGLKFYAGYPITPATDIMEFLAEELPKYGGCVIQTEDEIAAIGAVLGASYTGRRAMTATSGPGFSLMVEMLGLASTAEIPAVIVDVQRSGPSTGMPTKTEQGDLLMAIYAGHSSPPRVVIGLTSVKDCFPGIIRAFNIAEEFQIPVIVLSDQYLGHRKATVPKPDTSKIELVSRRRPTPEELREYRRYRLGGDGVSPYAIPGTPGGQFQATGLEHTENGMPSGDPANHTAMIEKRAKKLKKIEEMANTIVRRYGAERPAIGILGWGSTEGVIREAVTLCNDRGLQVAALHPKILWPLPTQAILEFVKPLKTLIIPELNANGQYAGIIHDIVEVPIVQLNKCNGLPFTPMDIVHKVEEVARRHG